ncbi:MAG: hypothetical protein KA791_02010 [Flavobacteriales bacterium]|nr:hypothetical protein [Flavobacteriales bacterium]
MTRTARNTLLLLTLGGGLVAGVALVLVLTVPSFKLALKEKLHRWKCPDVPEYRSEKRTTPEGSSYWDDRGFRGSYLANEPNLHYGFEDRPSTFFHEVDGQGVLLLDGRSHAITRRIGDVSDNLVSISAGILMKCDATDPDVRIIIRIDHPDGTLLEWNEKRLLAIEHRPDQWERFNFEWILRDLTTSPDDLVSMFVIGDAEGVWIDDLSVVYRSRTPVRPAEPHA